MEYSEKRKQENAVYRARLLEYIFSIYGDACNCCGEAEIKFLTIDHANGRPPEHGTKSGYVLYAWLRKQGTKDPNLRILCFNCNLGRERNGGTCPHG